MKAESKLFFCMDRLGEQENKETAMSDAMIFAFLLIPSGIAQKKNYVYIHPEHWLSVADH